MWKLSNEVDQTFSLVNLLGLNPLRRPAPNPLIFALPTVPTVYVLPVIRFSLAILNSRQLSLLICLAYFLFEFFEVKIGDSPRGDIVSINSSISSIASSDSIYYSLKYGWLRAS